MAWSLPDNHIWATGEVVSAANMNTYLRLNLDFLYGDTGWTTAGGFSNGWVNKGGGTQPASYRLIGTRVYLRGAISSGTLGLAFFTLPVGYRPSWQTNQPVVSNALYGYCTVTTAGAIIPAAGSNSDFWLDSVTFDTV